MVARNRHPAAPLPDQPTLSGSPRPATPQPPPVLELAGDQREVLSGRSTPCYGAAPGTRARSLLPVGTPAAQRDQDERRAGCAGYEAQAVRHPALPRGVYRREPARPAGTGDAGGKGRGPVESQSEERSAEAANERRHGFGGGGRRLTCRWRGTRRRPSALPRSRRARPVRAGTGLQRLPRRRRPCGRAAHSPGSAAGYG